MPLPQYPKKHDQEVIITPRQHFQAEREHYADFQPPKAVVLCFESAVMNHYKALDHTHLRPFWTGEMIYLGPDGHELAIVGNFGIGGPAAAHMLEILIAAGVQHFIVVGHAGGLQKANSVGSMVLIDKAVRDEGLSHHYLEPGKFAYPSQTLSEQLQHQLEQEGLAYKTGPTWTLDSMYRETKEEIGHYVSEGVATVEMELASLFAVATFRKVSIAALLVISDYVAFEKWEEHLHASPTANGLFDATQLSVKTLSHLS